LVQMINEYDILVETVEGKRLLGSQEAETAG
jgi:hypothetical protein